MDEITQNKSCSPRRAHLTKEQRLPQYLKETEKVLRTVKSCQSNFKTVLANSRLRGSVYKKVYNLTINVLKCYNYIQKIIDKINLLDKEKFLRREIASILIYEIIFGTKNLPGESKIITTIRTYENEILKVHQEFQGSNVASFMIKELSIPRYVRVHTLVTTVPYVIKDLECLGYKQIIYDCLSEEKYIELVKNLEQGCFVIDFHFKDILVFSCNENLTSLDLYKNGHIFLQDKASCIPVHALNPEPGCAVLDACAAPGMKTIHIASKMENKGILIACERDKDRFETLKEMVKCGAVKICKVFCKDFKQLDPNDQAYSAIEYILLDPSCSGSGMVSRMDEVTDTEDSKNKDRLTKLAGFQIILLKHALRFPSVKRVVYSTCSVNEEENEYVVHEALSSCYGAFKLVPVMPEWSERGSENFEFGNLCLRTVPEKHLTNGFFVAMFERVDCGEYGRKMHTSRNRNSSVTLQDESCSDFKILKKKKMKENLFDIQKKSEIHESPVCNEDSNQFMEEKHGTTEIISYESKKSKKRKKKKKEGKNLIDLQSETNRELTDVNHDDNVCAFNEKKKRESCELPPNPSKSSDSNSIELEKKIKGTTSDMLNKVPEIDESCNQFKDEIDIAREINFDYDLKKPKKPKKKKKEKGEQMIDSYLEVNEETTLNQIPETGESCNQFKDEKYIAKEMNFDCDLNKPKKLKKKKKEKGEKVLGSYSEVNEKLPEKLIDVDSNSQECSIIENVSPSEVSGTIDSTFHTPKKEEKHKNKENLGVEITSEIAQITDSIPNATVYKKKKRKKEHFEDSDFQSNEFNSSSNLEMPVHKKKKRKKEHSKDSDFQCNELNQSLNIDGNLSLSHNEQLDLSDNMASSLSKPPKHRKNKKHKGISTPDSKEASMCASFESDFLTSKNSKNAVEKTNEIICGSNVEMLASLESDCIVNKKHKSKKHKTEKAVNLERPAETVPNSEMTLVCASTEADQIPSKKSKKHKSEKHKIELTDEIAHPNQEEVNTSIENDFLVKKKSKKCKSKKHEIEKMGDLEGTDKTDLFYAEETGSFFKNDSAVKNKIKKCEIENVGFSESHERDKIITDNSKNALKSDSLVNDSLKVKKSKKVKNHFQKKDDMSSIDENKNESVLTDDENKLKHSSLINSLKQTNEDCTKSKYDFTCTLPKSEEELEAVLFN